MTVESDGSFVLQVMVARDICSNIILSPPRAANIFIDTSEHYGIRDDKFS